MNKSCDPPKGFKPPPLTEEKKRNFDSIFFSPMSAPPPLAIDPTVYEKQFEELFTPDAELFKRDSIQIDKEEDTNYQVSTLIYKPYTPASEEELLYLKISKEQRKYDHLTYVAYNTHYLRQSLFSKKDDYNLQVSKLQMEKHPFHAKDCHIVNQNQYQFLTKILDTLE